MAAMRRMLVAPVLAVVVMLVACGDDEPSGDGGSSSGGAVTPGAPIAEAELLERYTAAYCETLGPCCGKYSVPFDEETCTTMVRNALEPSLTDAAERGRRYDADAAGQCVASIRAAITACDASAINPADLANAANHRGSICRRIYTGTKAIDETCDSTSDCAQPAGRIVVCATNRCREYQRAGAGAACKSFYDEDEPGPYVDCGEELECRIGDDASGVCAAREAKGTAKEGAACKASSDCATNRCFQNRCFTGEMGIGPAACAKPLS